MILSILVIFMFIQCNCLQRYDFLVRFNATTSNQGASYYDESANGEQISFVSVLVNESGDTYYEKGTLSIFASTSHIIGNITFGAPDSRGVTNLLYFVSYGGTSLEGPVKGDYYGASVFRITGGEGKYEGAFGMISDSFIASNSMLVNQDSELINSDANTGKSLHKGASRVPRGFDATKASTIAPAHSIIAMLGFFWVP